MPCPDCQRYLDLAQIVEGVTVFLQELQRTMDDDHFYREQLNKQLARLLAWRQKEQR